MIGDTQERVTRMRTCCQLILDYEQFADYRVFYIINYAVCRLQIGGLLQVGRDIGLSG